MGMGMGSRIGGRRAAARARMRKCELACIGVMGVDWLSGGEEDAGEVPKEVRECERFELYIHNPSELLVVERGRGHALTTHRIQFFFWPQPPPGERTMMDDDSLLSSRVQRVGRELI